jgi:hypothetical protein
MWTTSSHFWDWKVGSQQFRHLTIRHSITMYDQTTSVPTTAKINLCINESSLGIESSFESGGVARR